MPQNDRAKEPSKGSWPVFRSLASYSLPGDLMVSRLPGVLGLESPSGPTLDRIGVLATELGRTNPFTLCIGFGVLAVVFISEKISAKIPGALIGLVAATLAVIGLGLESK